MYPKTARRFGVGVGQTLLHAGVEQFRQLVFAEAEEGEIDIQRLQFGQFARQQLQVPRRQIGDLVVRDAIRLGLLRRQLAGHVHGHLVQPELRGCFPSRMPDDNDAVGVDDDRLAEAESPDRLGNGVDRRVVVAGVLLVRLNLSQRPKFDVHV